LRRLTRCSKNPVITPEDGQAWEAGGTFNPSAIVTDETIHILYRAVDRNGTSRLGYARSLDGEDISSRSPTPVLQPSTDWEEFGCEDPRITQLNGSFYVTYTAFSKRGPRIALASTRDFTHFNKYGLVGPDLNDKDCALFPETINGKLAMLHRLDGKIQIAYFENLEALKSAHGYWEDYLKHLEDFEVIKQRFPWETLKIGTGPPPIRTEKGWLVIYHGVSKKRVYRVGALLLDLDDPKKVIARTREPILEPETEFEKLGVVPNVVFPDGAIVHEGKLLVYYGGADRVSCAANAPLDEFLEELEKETP
jgi:predicted GH43/DUF377 family glycosyl hydrolase